MTPRAFRVLLLSFWALFGAYFAFHSMTYAQLPADLRELARHRAAPAWQASIAGLNLLVSIWNTVELFYFKQRGRPVYVAVLAVGLVASLWGPITIEIPLAAVWMFLQSMVAGALLVAMYSTPLAGYFVRPPGDAA